MFLFPFVTCQKFVKGNEGTEQQGLRKNFNLTKQNNVKMVKRKKMAQRKSKFLSSSYLVAKKKLAKSSTKGKTRFTQVIFGTVQLSISLALSILC